MPRRRAAAAALALAALAAASPAAPAAAPDDLRWVRGVNYVPSTSHNDVATFQDYNATLVEAELAFAAASGFNAVRVFLSTLPWLYDAAAFRGRLTHLVATLEALGLTSQLVLFDSCFGAETANVSWITSGAYKNASWIPNPGPAIVANESAWAQYDAYIADVASIAGASRAVLVYDLHNEPDFNVPRMVDFIRHVGEVLQAIEGAAARPRTVGIAYSSQQGLVQDVVTLLSFHNYDGGGGGLGLARDIAGQRALADASKRALLLTETMARPTDLLTSVLPAVSGCINVSSVATIERSAASAVGFFVWELMLGVDQFNHDWSAPYQGMVYPSWAPAGLGGECARARMCASKRERACARARAVAYSHAAPPHFRRHLPLSGRARAAAELLRKRLRGLSAAAQRFAYSGHVAGVGLGARRGVDCVERRGPGDGDAALRQRGRRRSDARGRGGRHGRLRARPRAQARP